MAETLNPTAADDTADDATMVADRKPTQHQREQLARDAIFKSDPYEDDESSPE